MLKADPWDVQEAIMRSVAAHPRTTVRSCHNSGKSWTVGALGLWWVYCRENALFISTAPTERQVRDVLWQEVRQHHARAGLPGNMNTMDLTVSPTQRAIGFTAREPEKFQGFHSENILVAVDEASGLHPRIWEAIEGILTGPNPRLVVIGNPTDPTGRFYETFRSPLYEGGRFHISAFDVPERLLPPGWRDQCLREWGAESAMYQVKVLGEFPAQASDSLIALPWAEAAQEREISDHRAAVEIGVDVARYGEDETAVCVRQGGAVLALRAWNGVDTVDSSGRVKAMVEEFGAVIVKTDDPGVGGGVTDILTHAFAGTEVTVIGINVGEAAWDKEIFHRRRDELWWGLRDRFAEGRISIPADDMLLDQLTAIKYGYTPSLQRQIESKDDMKKSRSSAQRWSSPDRADSVMLAFAECGNRFVPWSLVGEARPM